MPAALKKSKKNEVEEPVTRYVMHVSVPGIGTIGIFDGGNGVQNWAVDENGKPLRRKKGHRLSAMEKFCMAWGFEDGAPNEIVGEAGVGPGMQIVAKPAPEGFQEAASGLYASARIPILVSIYKNGRREFKLL